MSEGLLRWAADHFPELHATLAQVPRPCLNRCSGIVTNPENTHCDQCNAVAAYWLEHWPATESEGTHG